MTKKPPELIAELSANHAQDLQNTKDSILAAKHAKASAVKIQTYQPSCLTLKSNHEIFKIKGGLWDGRYLHDLYTEAMLPWEWHAEIFSYAKQIGIEVFSSPFSIKAFEFLEKLDCPRYKIASFECVDSEFIRVVASSKKPMIISTGIATKAEIAAALEACHRVGNHDITFLQCTSAYPAKISEANLMAMRTLGSEFGVKYGLSDHTLGSLCAILAVALGASMIEKHFILDSRLKTPDSEFSMSSQEFALMAETVHESFGALGDGHLREEEVKSQRVFARSLFVIKDIKKGEILTPSHIASLRPNAGLHPRFLHEVLGKKVTRDIKAQTPLSLEHVQR